MSVGVALTALSVLFFYNRFLPRLNFGNLFFVLLCVLVFFAFIHALFFIFIDFSLKKLAALFSLIILFASAAFFSVGFMNIQERGGVRLLVMFFLIVSLCGVGGWIFDFNFLNYELYVKSVFPFSEPSHYAIAASSVLMFVGIYFYGIRRLMVVALVGVMALAMPSVVLLFLLLMMVFIYYFHHVGLGILLLGFLVCVVLSVVFWMPQLDVSYFVERLDFSKESKNLTALVYMQGWEEICNSLVVYGSMGVGFMNMEMTAPGVYGELIRSIAGEYKNRAEGSFLASKLITEFGLIGLVLVFFYISLFFRSLGFLLLCRRRDGSFTSYAGRKVSPQLVFANSSVVTFFIEMFLRGPGYFSIGVFFLVMSVFVIFSKKYSIEYIRQNVLDSGTSGSE